MASEKAANKARELFSDQLFGSGAHAVAVDKVSIEGEEAFALIAMVPPSHEANLPASVAVTVGSKQLTVPVVVRNTAPFKPE